MNQKIQAPQQQSITDMNQIENLSKLNEVEKSMLNDNDAQNVNPMVRKNSSRLSLDSLVDGIRGKTADPKQMETTSNKRFDVSINFFVTSLQ